MNNYINPDKVQQDDSMLLYNQYKNYGEHYRNVYFQYFLSTLLHRL